MLEFIESSAEAFKSVVVVGVELIADVSSFCSAVAVVDITVIAFVVANTGVDVAATAVVVVVVGLVVGEFDKLTDHFVELGELVHGET